jgi:hypothetical protein
MAFTYEWEVTSLKTKNQLNLEGTILVNSVCNTYWKVTGTDETGTGSFSGATPFCADNCTAADFIEFSELTEIDVLTWIQNIVANDLSYKEHIDSQIQKQIDVVSITEPAMPWAAVVVEETPPE